MHSASSKNSNPETFNFEVKYKAEEKSYWNSDDIKRSDIHISSNLLLTTSSHNPVSAADKLSMTMEMQRTGVISAA